jgi:hypothetical protein
MIPTISQTSWAARVPPEYVAVRLAYVRVVVGAGAGT